MPDVPQSVDPLARQMAQLIGASDLDELREIVKRWLAEAPTERIRRQYEEFGARLLDSEARAARSARPALPRGARSWL